MIQTLLFVGIYLPKPFATGQEVPQGQFLSKVGLNSGFSFSQTGCQTKARESSLPHYLIIAWESRKDGFIPFPKASG